jgi:TPR repeat protein
MGIIGNQTGIKGSPRDAWRVGRIYSNGVGVPKDYQKAFEFANKGAERGYACKYIFFWEFYGNFRFL